jgi:hypothetical protein
MTRRSSGYTQGFEPTVSRSRTECLRRRILGNSASDLTSPAATGAATKNVTLAALLLRASANEALQRRVHWLALQGEHTEEA